MPDIHGDANCRSLTIPLDMMMGPPIGVLRFRWLGGLLFIRCLVYRFDWVYAAAWGCCRFTDETFSVQKRLG